LRSSRSITAATSGALFALARLGAIMVADQPRIRAARNAYVLNHAEVSGVIASMTTIAKARQAAADLRCGPVRACSTETTIRRRTCGN